MGDEVAFPRLARKLLRGLAQLERGQICCGDFTLQQFETLRRVQDAPGLTTSALSQRLGIDLSTASRNLTILERDGYLARSRARDDARHVVHRLTAKGRRCLDTLCCDERTVFGALLERVAPARRAAVVAAMTVLCAALDAPAEGAAASCASAGDDAARCAPGRSTRSAGDDA